MLRSILRRLLKAVILPLLAILPLRLDAQQKPLVEKWEKIGPIEFTDAVRQNPKRIVLGTTHGYLYITEDEGATWRRQEVADSIKIKSLSYADPLHGIIIPEFGPKWMTTDGGESWFVKKDTILWPFYAAYTSKDTIHIVNWIGNIFRSTDGGESWQERFTVSDTATSTWDIPTRIKFFGTQRGYVLQTSGILVETTDGGDHWTSRNISAKGYGLLDIDFVNKDTGVIGGIGHWYVTKDGGRNWVEREMAHDATWNDMKVIRFYDDHSFFGFGSPNEILYQSTNLGESLNILDFPQAPTARTIIESGNGWLVAGTKGTLLNGVRREAGNAPQWKRFSECNLGIDPLIASANGRLLAATSGSRPCYSADSGIFWHYADLRYNNYAGIHFVSPDKGYLLGYSGMSTPDSGKSWAPVEITVDGTSKEITKPTFSSAMSGFAITGITVIQTSDGGLTWQSKSSPGRAPSLPGYAPWFTAIQSIQALSADTALMLIINRDTLQAHAPGDSPYKDAAIYVSIYRTTDGAQTWKQMQAPLVHTGSQIYFWNSLMGYITCDSGRILKTMDAGSTWELQHVAPANRFLNAVRFLDRIIGIVSMDTSAILTTADGGISWNWLDVPRTPDVLHSRTMGITFPDADNVLVACEHTYYDYPSITDGGYYRGKLMLTTQKGVSAPHRTDATRFMLSVYPNPATDAIRVRLERDWNGPVSATIYDLHGKELRRVVGLLSELTIDVRDLISGNYLLECQSVNEQTVQPFTIVR